MEQGDYYQILGVDRNATPKQIKESYRKLALQFHPDRNRDASAAIRMKEINEAYAVLSDSGKRGEYDTLRRNFGSSAHSQFRRNYTEQDIFRHSDIRQVYEEIGRMFGVRGFDEIFREFYGPGYQTFEFRRPGIFAHGFTFDPHRVAKKTDTRSSMEHIPTGALGRIFKFALRKKWGIKWPERGKDLNDRISVPSTLAASGGKVRFICRKRRREFKIAIPSGVKDGQRIRLKGMGEEGQDGGESGDLYVTIRIHTSFLQTVKDALKRVLSR